MSIAQDTFVNCSRPNILKAAIKQVNVAYGRKYLRRYPLTPSRSPQIVNTWSISSHQPVVGEKRKLDDSAVDLHETWLLEDLKFIAAALEELAPTPVSAPAPALAPVPVPAPLPPGSAPTPAPAPACLPGPPSATAPACLPEPPPAPGSAPTPSPLPSLGPKPAPAPATKPYHASTYIPKSRCQYGSAPAPARQYPPRPAPGYLPNDEKRLKHGLPDSWTVLYNPTSRRLRITSTDGTVYESIRLAKAALKNVDDKGIDVDE